MVDSNTATRSRPSLAQRLESARRERFVGRAPS